MTMRIYKSTDASAPTLQGIVGGALSGSDWADGSFLQLLRKVLVTGYGSKTAAGWTQSFAGTSEGAFKQGGGCGFYVNVTDDGTMTAGAREANMRGFETMTALHTGTGLFPTVAQITNGVLFRKSDTADTTQRQWIAFADNKTFYVFSWTGNATAYYSGMMFGDIYSYVSGDAYNCMIIGRVTSAAADTVTNETLDVQQPQATSTCNGHYIARGYNQAGGAINISKNGQFFTTNAAGSQGPGQVGSMPYPNASDGKLWLARAYVSDPTTAPTNSLRGFLRGFWIPQSAGVQLPFEYTINGSGGLSGRTFRVLGLRTGINANSRYCMETSDTWD